MDDMQSKVAARRAQLAEQEKQAAAEEVAVTAKRQVALQRQKEAAVENISAELSVNGVAVTRNGEELVITERALPLIDVEGLKQDKIDNLLKSEARKMWTPGQNWLVIGMIVGGACLLPAGGVGLLGLGVGLWARFAINKNHRATLRDTYPDIFSNSEKLT